jgi:hypothetical protein
MSRSASPVPVAEGSVGEGRVAAGELPGGTVASAWHLGAHDRLGDAYAGLQAWLQQYGHQPQGAGWEVYHWIDLDRSPIPPPGRTRRAGAHSSSSRSGSSPPWARTATPATGPPPPGGGGALISQQGRVRSPRPRASITPAGKTGDRRRWWKTTLDGGGMARNGARRAADDAPSRGGTPMKQYQLSVYQREGPIPSEVPRRSSPGLDPLNQKLKAAAVLGGERLESP